MTPHKHSPGGTLMIDRSFRGIGRIHRASGIKREATFNLFNHGLTELADEPAGREWIRAFQRGDVEGVDLWGVIKTGKWRTPPRPETAGSLVDAIAAWREDTKAQVSDDTYRVRHELVTRVRVAARGGATVEELPNVLREMKRQMKDAPATFNLLRNYIRAFVRDTLGTRHELYQVIKHDIGPIVIPGHAKKKERKRHPLSPGEVLLLASKFPTKHRGGAEGAPGHGHIAIGMALTGMHPKEYFGDWSQYLTHVHVHGTKREGRDRLVPKLYPSTLWPHRMLKRPTISKHSFERAFAAARKAAKLMCTPLDLRRSHSTWMESAGVERTLRRIIRGHGPKDVGDLYETRELQKHLADVGQLMIAWIDAQLEQRPQLVVEEAHS